MLGALMGLMMLGSPPEVLTLPPQALIIPVDPKAVWIEKLHDCENEGNRWPKKMDTNGKYSYGYVHFQMGTWLSYGKPFGATEENIQDDELQKKVARSMLDNGGQGHWLNCSNKIGDYPI